MNVMVLTPYLPHARVGHGGGTAVRDLVRALARSHEVLVVSLLRPGETGLETEVEALGARVVTIPFLDDGARGLDRLALLAARGGAWGRALRSGYPLYVQKYRTRAIARRVIAAAEAFAPDAIQVEYLQMALLVRDLRIWRDARGGTGPKLVLNSHELGSLPRERRAAAAGNGRRQRRELAEAARWRRLQVDASGWADTTLCVTPQDHELYAAMGGHHLRTVPLGMDTATLEAVWAPPADGPETHLFVASYAHRPNRLAAELLVTRIWPLVRAARPAAHLLLAGRGSREFLAELPAGAVGDGVAALGFVDDLAPLYREATTVVAPLPEGGGIKIKVLEALARGVPVVTTPVGAEGITVPADGAAVIAPADERFAAALVDLAGNPARLADLSRRGRSAGGREVQLDGDRRDLGRDLRPGGLSSALQEGAQGLQVGAAASGCQLRQQGHLGQPLHRLQAGERRFQVRPHCHHPMASQQHRIVIADPRQHGGRNLLGARLGPRRQRHPRQLGLRFGQQAAVEVAAGDREGRGPGRVRVADPAHVGAGLVEGAVQGPFAGGAAGAAAAGAIDQQQVLGPQRPLGDPRRRDQKRVAAESNREVPFGGHDQALGLEATADLDHQAAQYQLAAHELNCRDTGRGAPSRRRSIPAAGARRRQPAAAGSRSAAGRSGSPRAPARWPP